MRVQQLHDLTAAPALRTDALVRLSRLVVLRPAEGGFVLESLATGWRMRVAGESTFRVLRALASPVRPDALLAGAAEAHRPALLALLELCHREGVTTEIGADGRAAEDAGALGHWEPHDLLFHLRSRRGRTDAPVGATGHLRGVLEEEPPLKPSAGPALALPRPDLERLAREDAPFSRVLEERRTRYSVAPLRLDALAEFLFRTCRVTGTRVDTRGDRFQRRVYPSGGALHPLEVYAAVHACDGVEPGLYHYRPAEHALAPVCGYTDEVRELLAEAQRGTGALPGPPPVLLIVSARFRRVALKYQSVAYRLTVAEVGGLFQTMYLVATAMGLSPCAVGAGDAERFAAAAGTEYFAETSVGEFILGGAPS